MEYQIYYYMYICSEKEKSLKNKTKEIFEEIWPRIFQN